MHSNSFINKNFYSTLLYKITANGIKFNNNNNNETIQIYSHLLKERRGRHTPPFKLLNLRIARSFRV